MRQKSWKKLFRSDRKVGLCLLSFSLVSCFSLVSWTLSSCASNSSFLSKDLISTGKGDKFLADNGTLADIAKASLKTKGGYNSFLKWKIGEVLQYWFENNRSKNYQDAYKDFKKDVDSEWNRKVSTAKESYRTSYEVNLRSVLDDAGVKNVNAWKVSELNNKVINKFVDDVFGVDYLGVEEDNKSTDLPKKKLKSSISADFISNTTNWKNFKFIADEADLDLTNGLNRDVANVYAGFQEFVFDKWVSNTLPVLTCGVLYKNSQPRGGLKEIFNDKNDVDLTPSYEFQVFPDSSEGDGLHDQQKKNANDLYVELIDNIEKYYDWNTDGINLPANWTEDSSTGIFVKPLSMYSDLYLPYAAGVDYLLLNSVGGVEEDNKIRDIKFSDLNKTVEVRNNNGGEPAGESANHVNILKSFFYKKNGDGKEKQWWGFSDPEYFRSVLVPNINNDKYRFYSYLGQDENGYAISDMFTTSKTIKNPSASSNSDKNLAMLFLRDGPNEGGVHIITIDGLNHFVVDRDNGKEIDLDRLKNFLKYRSLQKSCGLSGYKEPSTKGNNVSFEIKTNIENYFTSNDDVKFDLLVSFLASKKNLLKNSVDSVHQDGLEKLIDDSFDNDLFSKLLTDWEAYALEEHLLEARQKVRSAVISNAKKFIDNIKNSKPEANGIAGRLPFLINSKNGEIEVLEKFYLFNRNDNHAWWNSKEKLSGISLPSLSEATPTVFKKYGNSSVEDAVNKYIDSLNLVNASDSQIDYAKYVQCVYTNVDCINSAINSLLTASDKNNFIKNSYKTSLFKKDKFRVITCDDEFKVELKNSKVSSDILNHSIANTYYLKNFFISKLDDNSIISSGILNGKDKLLGYLNALWSGENFKYSETQVDYLLFLNTLDYLLSPESETSGDEHKKINLVKYLKQDIPFGMSAYIAWVAGTTYSKIDEYSNLENLFKNPDSFNVNYDFGSESNYLNLSNIDNNKPNRYLLNSIYRNSKPTDNNCDYYGFYGLVTDGLHSELPEDLGSYIFSSSHSLMGKKGSLFGYGELDRVKTHINSFQTPSQVQSFALELQNKTGISEFVDSTKSGSIDELKKKMCEILDKPEYNELFAKNSGFVTENKFLSSGSNSVSVFPIQDSTKTKAGYFAYLLPVNYLEVDKVSDNWSADANSRLGLSIDSFLQLVMDYAINNSLAQQSALARLVGDRVQAFDERIMNLLTSQWVFTKKKVEK